MRIAATGIACFSFCLHSFAFTGSGENPDSISSKLSSKYINAIGDRSAVVSTEIDKNTEKYLGDLKKQEQVLHDQLAKIDVNAAARIFEGSTEKYEKLQNDLKNNSENVLNAYGRYVPGIDSAITSLKFLQQGALSNSKLSGQTAQITAAMGKVKDLEDQFKKADNVEDFIKQRKAYLEQQLKSYSNLGSGLQQYSSKAYYYSQQISDLKQDWQDPSRAEQKAMSILNKYKPFQDFMKKNSLIAGLFNIPDDYNTAGLGGLQTRDMVQKIMQQSLTVLGPNGSGTAQANVNAAQSTLTTLRSNIEKSGSSGDLPDSKANTQKTRSFAKRLEYGVNFQNTGVTTSFPMTTSIAGTLGYKLNNRSIIGVGVAYTVGLGQSIQHIHITNQGIGIRSFLDVKIQGTFYASGGYELNYLNAFTSIRQITVEHLWQRSGLIGISKIISMQGSFAKKTKVQLFWDILSYYQIPRTQPIKFRIGYTF